MSTTYPTPDYIQNFDTLLYRVSPGDTLPKILQKYHGHLDSTLLSALTQKVLADNPTINPAMLKPDQLISLKIPQHYCAAPADSYRPPLLSTESERWLSELERTWERSTREERDLLSILLPASLGLGGAKMSMIDITFSTNAPILQEMVNNYEDFKAGKKTRGQYDYQRKKLITKLETKLGPTNVLLNGRKKPTEVLRISRSRGTTPTEPIESKLRTMQKTAKLAKAGGVMLTGVSLGIACEQIASATTQREKNDFLVESAGGFVGGIVYSFASSVAVALMSTPVGWFGSLVIGLGAAATGYSMGRFVLKLYDITGAKVDFAQLSGIGSLCSPSSSPKVGHSPRLSSSTLSVL